MPIYYALFENNLTSDPNDYSAQVQINASVDLDGVAERMVKQGSTVTKPDILAVLEDTIAACESLVLEGNRVVLGGLCELFPRVIGVFTGAMDSYDQSRHTVDVAGVAGSRVRKTVRDSASVMKLESVKPMPAPVEYEDLGSGERNATCDPGNIGTLNGNRLKFDATKADEGIYFIGLADGATTKVTLVQKNKPSQLVFLNPATLIPDEYHLEVRARINKGEELRTGRLDATLIVP